MGVGGAESGLGVKTEAQIDTLHSSLFSSNLTVSREEGVFFRPIALLVTEHCTALPYRQAPQAPWAEIGLTG